MIGSPSKKLLDPENVKPEKETPCNDEGRYPGKVRLGGAGLSCEGHREKKGHRKADS